MDGKEVDFGCVDVISSLPDELLAKILSYLPTKRAASTSLVSKRWKNLFPLMKLLFASQHHYYLDNSELLNPRQVNNKDGFFKDFVDKTLSGTNSIKKLSLICQDDHLLCFAHANQWIRNALERGVVDLELRLETFMFREASFPPPSILANKTLVKLTLGIKIGYDGSHFRNVSLPVLKRLSIHTVESIHKFLFGVILPGCPILEELSLYHSWGQDSFFAISHKTLKRLTVHFDKIRKYHCPYLPLRTPSLVYLDYSGFVPLNCSNGSFSDSLVEAKLDVRVQPACHIHSDLFADIISWMRNVKTLSLSSASTKLMYSGGNKELPLFCNLVKLYFASDTNECWEMLPRVLNKSPKLETLVLEGLHCVTKDQGMCIDPSEVKVLEIHGFRGSGEELRQVKCFLCQMQFVQVMKVNIDADDNKKVQVITSDLLALSKPSSKFHIQFL